MFERGHVSLSAMEGEDYFFFVVGQDLTRRRGILVFVLFQFSSTDEMLCEFHPK